MGLKSRRMKSNPRGTWVTPPGPPTAWTKYELWVQTAAGPVLVTKEQFLQS